MRAAGVATALEESGPDHAALLERFQEQMEEVSVADRTILFQSAIEEVRASADLARLPLRLLDVPIHSAIERAFIAELASAAKEVLFTCRAADIRTLDNLKMVPRAQENAALPNKAPNKRGALTNKSCVCMVVSYRANPGTTSASKLRRMVFSQALRQKFIGG